MPSDQRPCMVCQKWYELPYLKVVYKRNGYKLYKCYDCNKKKEYEVKKFYDEEQDIKPWNEEDEYMNECTTPKYNRYTKHTLDSEFNSMRHYQ